MCHEPRLIADWFVTRNFVSRAARCSAQIGVDMLADLACPTLWATDACSEASVSWVHLGTSLVQVFLSLHLCLLPVLDLAPASRHDIYHDMIVSFVLQVVYYYHLGPQFQCLSSLFHQDLSIRITTYAMRHIFLHCNTYTDRSLQPQPKFLTNPQFCLLMHMHLINKVYIYLYWKLQLMVDKLN